MRFQLERQISKVEPLSLSVPQVEILRLLGGSVDVYYQVAPFSQRNRAFIRALSQQESARLALSVRRDVAELPLPAPTLKDDKGRLITDGGFLDPTSTEAILEAAPYVNIAKGDEITYRWLGTGSTRTQTYKVADPAKPPADYADHDFIVQNIGGNVVVSYSVRRLGVGDAVPSTTLDFRIDVAVPFELDTSLLTLSNTNVTQGHQAKGGVTPYQYTSSNTQIVKVTDGDKGLIQAVTDGDAYILVNDSATPKHSDKYPVKVAGTIPFFVDTNPVTLSSTQPAQGHQASGGVTPYHYESSNTQIVNVTYPDGSFIQAVTDGDAYINVRDSATPAHSGKYSVKVVGTIPFTIDTYPLTLSNTDPTQGHRARGGVTPYRYSSDDACVRVTNNVEGVIQAVTDGNANILVSDSATPPHLVRYPVKVVGTIPFYIDTDPLTLSSTQPTQGHQASGGVKPYHYASSDQEIVIVTHEGNGIIRAITDGNVDILVSDSATPAHSKRYPVTAIGTIPFTIDKETLTLSNTNPTQGHQAKGGVKPYAYTSNSTNVKVTDDAKGIIQAVTAGDATIFVRDSATPAHSASYPVKSVIDNGTEWAVNFTAEPARDIPYGTSYRIAPITIAAIAGTGHGSIFLGADGGAGPRLSIGGNHNFDSTVMIGGRVSIKLDSMNVAVKFTVEDVDDDQSARVEFFVGNVAVRSAWLPKYEQKPVELSFEYPDGFDRIDFWAGHDWFSISQISGKTSPAGR